MTSSNSNKINISRSNSKNNKRLLLDTSWTLPSSRPTRRRSETTPDAFTKTPITPAAATADGRHPKSPNRHVVLPSSHLYKSHRRSKKCAIVILVVKSVLLVIVFAFCVTLQFLSLSLRQQDVTSSSTSTTTINPLLHAPPQPNNGFDNHWNQLLAKDSSRDWYPLGTTQTPYSDMTPQMDVVWARGWYNALSPPDTVPLEYYNRAGLGGGRTSPDLLQEYFPPTLCGPRWMRIDDVGWWVATVLPEVRCNITLITSDGILDVPTHVSFDIDTLLESPYLEVWYAQNTVLPHPKLLPIPVGLPIHYGFPDSPHSAHTVATMLEVRQSMPSFRERSRKILLDPGTVSGGGPRRDARLQAYLALRNCPERVEIMDPTNPVDTWRHHYSTHQFAVIVRGTGWDTYRTWEYLLYGTVPIMMAGTPMDLLHLPAHTPVVQIQEWSDICEWTDGYYDALVDRYEGWIANAHQWLRPSLWVPRNQPEMERLCDISPGCRTTTAPWISPSRHLKETKAEQLEEKAENPVAVMADGVRWDHTTNEVTPPVPNIHDDEDLGLTPEERDALLKVLLQKASQEDIEHLLADEGIKEKLLSASKAETITPARRSDFEACLQKCDALQTETAPCVIFGEALTFSCEGSNQ